MTPGRIASNTFGCVEMPVVGLPHAECDLRCDQVTGVCYLYSKTFIYLFILLSEMESFGPIQECYLKKKPLPGSVCSNQD